MRYRARGKRIVVCSDGTWARPEQDLKEDVPTNVLRLARAIQPVGRDGRAQQVFYDWGVGSYHDKLWSGATGSGLHKNVMDLYRYIVQNYTPGDELYFFGFSRGAYTVRSLSGLINNVGILKRPDAPLIEKAFQHYKRKGRKYKPNGPASVEFRRLHSHPVMKIRFVGVWDTVGAMGIPISFLGWLGDKHEFFDAKIGPNIQIARHALAIDERRGDFAPTIWSNHESRVNLKQVWFAGSHGDVGGGHHPDSSGQTASDTPFQWMLKEAQSAGLSFESHLTAALQPSPTARLTKSKKGFYHFKKGHRRRIDHGEGEIFIHRSVKERWERDPDYRPRNLVKYVRSGWGRLEE